MAAQQESKTKNSKKKAKDKNKGPPTSLFIFSGDNILRRCTIFIMDWPYPFTHILVSCTEEDIKLSRLPVLSSIKVE